MNILGIDFGTTKTLAARWDERTQNARIIRLGRSGDAIPTTIYADKNGKLEFGDDADDMRALDAAGWKARIKRDLGRGSAVVLNGHRYQVIELVAAFLTYVLKRVEEEVFHGPVNGCVITVPALYGPAERQELLEAAHKAGFKNVQLIEEPVAAGLAFLHEKTGTELGEQVLVFDWGGGTLDLALVKYKNGELSLNHEWIGGDKNLGGEDIDDSMVEGFDNLYSRDYGRIDELKDDLSLHIRRNLKEGKELLSRRSDHTFRLGFKVPVEFKCSRDQLEVYTSIIVNRALDCLQDQLRKLAAGGIQPKQILLVGGASSMPVIKRRIEDELGLKPILWENSQTAVALGAAHSAQRSSNPQPVDSDKRSRPPKVPKHYTKEVFVEKKEKESAAPQGHPLALSIGWNEVGVVVFAQPLGNENELEQIMNNSHFEITPSLFVKNVGNQPLNRIQVTGSYDGTIFTVSMPNYIPVLEVDETIELDPLTLNFALNDDMLLKVSWFGEKDNGCSMKVDFSKLEEPQPHLPIAVFLKNGTFTGKILQLYNGSSEQIKNLLFTKANGATYNLEELPPGGPCSIGWCEFSDSSNLKTGDIVVITKDKHRKTVVHIP